MNEEMHRLWKFCNMEPIRVIMSGTGSGSDYFTKVYSNDKYYVIDIRDVKDIKYNYCQSHIYKADINNNNGFRFIRSTKTYKIDKNDFYRTHICKNGCCLIIETESFRKKKFLEPTRLEMLKTVYAGLVSNKLTHDKNETIKSDVAPMVITQNIVKFLY